MGRTRRPHLPGVAFHLTARTQGREPLLQGLELAAVRILMTVAEHSDGELLAYAIMQNHLHLVYVQGRRPLAAFVQPLLTRIALLLRRRRQCGGHVFERRYQDRPCTDFRYLRNAISYVSLNPVRAGICQSPEAYEWTSHAQVLSARHEAAGCVERGALTALRLFSPYPDSSLDACRRSYVTYLEWRVKADNYKSSGAAAAGVPPPECGPLEGGQCFWEHHFGWAAMRARERVRAAPPLPDLRDLALSLLRESAPQMPLEILRGGGHGRELVRVRDAIIVRAAELGYRGSAIADFLRVSPSTVSRLKSRLSA